MDSFVDSKLSFSDNVVYYDVYKKAPAALVLAEEAPEFPRR